MSVLCFDNVSKQYVGGYEVLIDVSFEVVLGEMLFVIGYFGVGKSMLFKLIYFDEWFSRGVVVFDECNLLKVCGGDVLCYWCVVGVVYQDYCLLMDCLIVENVVLLLILCGICWGDINKCVCLVFECMGLGYCEKVLFLQLLVGEQQCVGIVCVIVGEFKLLVVDELIGNFDLILVVEIMVLFVELFLCGISVLVVSYDLLLLCCMCKCVLIFDYGWLVDDILLQDLVE